MKRKSKNIYTSWSFAAFIFLVMLALVSAGCGKHENDHEHEHLGEAGHTHEHEEAGTHETGEVEGTGHAHPGETATPTSQQEAAAEDDHDHDHDHLHISARKMTEWGIETGYPQQREFIERIRLTGVVKVNQNTTFLVNSLVPGVVTEVTRDIGDPVNRGTVLCILNSSALLELKNRYIQAFQDYYLTMQAYDRAKKLFTDKALEQKELLSRETKYKSNLAEYISLEAELEAMGYEKKELATLTQSLEAGDTSKLKNFLSPYHPIRAPGPGRIIARDLVPGERVEIDKTIFEISDMKKIWAIFDARETDLPYVEKGKKIEVYCDVYPGEVFEGRIIAVPEKVDPALRTVKARIEINNPGFLLKPEMYVTGALQTTRSQVFPGPGGSAPANEHSNYLAVPLEAVVKLSGVTGVFFKDTDGFLFKPVQVMGRDSAGFVFVTGLRLGEMIIVKGAFYMKAEYEIQRGAVDAHAGHHH